VKTFRGAATLTVDLPPEQALRLFTPEGERLWAEGWDPRYPAGSGSEDAGTVFVTGTDPRATVWMIVDSEPRRMRYARVAPENAGLVTVEVVSHTEGTTRLEVSYRLTALNPDGTLSGFAGGYQDFIASWETEIRSVLEKHLPE
jgi:hypothetical protein